MAIQAMRAVAGLACSAVNRKAGGLWRVLSAVVEGRNAVNFERERRRTLLALLPALPAGTRLHDRRTDGGVLTIHGSPATHINVALSGNTAQGAVSPGPVPEQGRFPSGVSPAQIVGE